MIFGSQNQISRRAEPGCHQDSLVNPFGSIKSGHFLISAASRMVSPRIRHVLLRRHTVPDFRQATTHDFNNSISSIHQQPSELQQVHHQEVCHILLLLSRML